MQNFELCFVFMATALDICEGRLFRDVCCTELSDKRGQLKGVPQYVPFNSLSLKISITCNNAQNAPETKALAKQLNIVGPTFDCPTVWNNEIIANAQARTPSC